MTNDWQFWAAVVGATLFKLLTSTTMSIVSAFVTVLAAILFAWAFTDAIVAHFVLNPATYRVPVAALLALTGEGMARTLINWASDPLKIIKEFVAMKTGGKL